MSELRWIRARRKGRNKHYKIGLVPKGLAITGTGGRFAFTVAPMRGQVIDVQFEEDVKFLMAALNAAEASRE